MLDGISKTFTDVFKSISGKSTITESNIKDAIAEIRVALLEADVNISVVRNFVKFVTDEALGEKVLRSVDPREQFIKLVYDRLVDTLGSKSQDLKLKPKTTLSVIMLAGLQGSGKTTTVGKLANFLKKREERKILLAACDTYRPAAIDQLERVGEMAGVEVYTGDKKNAVKIANDAVKYAKEHNFDTLIIDTAGRLHIDTDMMEEVQRIAKDVKPDEILFVADSMTGQTAATIAREFDNYLGVTGIVLTKFDSDTRGGAAFSIKQILGKPLKFVGVSEKLDGLDLFYPDRIASRILGMGDVVSLVEKAQEVYDEEEAKALAKKIRKSEFTLQDFLEQMQQMDKMGSIESVIEMLPGGKAALDKIDMKAFEKQKDDLKKKKAIIQSMTMKERLDYRLIMGSRKRRIARGAGVSVMAVENLLKTFQKTRTMMKGMLKNKGKYGGMDISGMLGGKF